VTEVSSYVVTPDPIESFDGGGGRVVTNLVVNPSFETNVTTFWSPVNGTVVQDDGTLAGIGPIDGSKLAWVTHTGGGFSIVTPSGSSGMSVTPGGRYFVRAQILVRSTDTYVVLPGITVAWSNVDGVLFGGGRVGEGLVIPDVDSLVFEVVTAPAGAYYLQLQMNADSTGSAAFSVDGVMVTAGAEQIPFFSGNTADTSTYRYDWTGTANLSTSTRTLL
jgi:hypothetical protein